MPDPFFTFLRSERRPPLTSRQRQRLGTAINILIVGTLRDSLVARVDQIRETRETPTRFTFDAHRIARSRTNCVLPSAYGACTPLEKGQVLRFVSADSARFTEPQQAYLSRAGLRFISGSLLRATAYI